MNEIIDLVETLSQRDSTSIPASILTTPSARTSNVDAEVTRMKALIASLQIQVANGHSNGGPNGNDGGRNNAIDNPNRRTTMRTEPPAENGPHDKRRTREDEDDGRTRKKYKNSSTMCHTHGYDCSKTHNSRTCLYPDKNHDKTATKDDPKDACKVYQRLNT